MKLSPILLFFFLAKVSYPQGVFGPDVAFASNTAINAAPVAQLQAAFPAWPLDVVFEVVNGQADKRAAKTKFQNAWLPNGTQWGYIIDYADYTYLEWDPAVGAWYKDTWYTSQINAGGIVPGFVVNLDSMADDMDNAFS